MTTQSAVAGGPPIRFATLRLLNGNPPGRGSHLSSASQIPSSAGISKTLTTPMIRTLAMLLLIAMAAIGALLVYEGRGGPVEGQIIGAALLACPVFTPAVLHGQESHERILNSILRELQVQAGPHVDETGLNTTDR
jgi:hypothetical protein